VAYTRVSVLTKEAPRPASLRRKFIAARAKPGAAQGGEVLRRNLRSLTTRRRHDQCAEYDLAPPFLSQQAKGSSARHLENGLTFWNSQNSLRKQTAPPPDPQPLEESNLVSSDLLDGAVNLIYVRVYLERVEFLKLVNRDKLMEFGWRKTQTVSPPPATPAHQS
jgi:hypothetical protein